MTDFDTFVAAYLEAVYFTEKGPDSEFPDADLSPEAVFEIKADCRSFWRRAGPFVLAHAAAAGWSHEDAVEQAGQDFWFTRNGHGVGFWDGDWEGPFEQILDTVARSYGEMIFYEGDHDYAGQLYVN